jgi:hypothetical protein
MNLTELQLLQKKVAGMTGDEFEDWLTCVKDEAYSEVESDSDSEGDYDDGWRDGYEAAKDEYDID